jgi:predicted ribosome quality control (RQC) complex YloA/Tae2 family protein
VGRNDKVNDKLTFGTLKKDDFWFHAAGTAGPHVAAPMREKNKTLDDETLLDACTLAAKFAGFKTGDEVEIIYARRKELNKPGKRAKPGAVVVAKPKYKTVVVEEERLRRLLKKDE